MATNFYTILNTIIIIFSMGYFIYCYIEDNNENNFVMRLILGVIIIFVNLIMIPVDFMLDQMLYIALRMVMIIASVIIVFSGIDL